MNYLLMIVSEEKYVCVFVIYTFVLIIFIKLYYGQVWMGKLFWERLMRSDMIFGRCPSYFNRLPYTWMRFTILSIPDG